MDLSKNPGIWENSFHSMRLNDSPSYKQAKGFFQCPRQNSNWLVPEKKKLYKNCSPFRNTSFYPWIRMGEINIRLDSMKPRG